MADPNENNKTRNVNGNKQHNGANSTKSTGNTQQQQQVFGDTSPGHGPGSTSASAAAAPAPVNAFDRTNLSTKLHLWYQKNMQRIRRQILQHTATTRPTQFAPDVGTNTRRKGQISTSSSDDNISETSTKEEQRSSHTLKRKSWIRRSTFFQQIPKKFECKGFYLTMLYYYYVDKYLSIFSVSQLKVLKAKKDVPQNKYIYVVMLSKRLKAV